MQCPKSIITAESLSLIEQYRIFKQFGNPDVHALSARVVDAIFVLEEASRGEELA